MAIEYYKGFDTYVIYGDETSYGAGASPSGSNVIGKVKSITVAMNNNAIKSQGMGEGRNATGGYLGNFDVSGSMEWELSSLTFLKYAIGTIAGSGTLASPYEFQELDNIGYTSGSQIPSIALEFGSEGSSNDDVITVTGVVINSLSITAEIGQPVRATCEFIGKTVASSTTLETYSAGSDKVLTVQDCAVTVDSDTFPVSSFTWTLSNNMQTHRNLGSRFIEQPVTGIRRYDYVITARKKYDSTSSVLSGTEARGLFFSGSTSATSPGTGAQATAIGTLSLDLIEGTATGDRTINLDLENAYFDSWSEPIALEGGVIEVTVNGYGLAGLTDGSVKVPLRYYTAT